MLRNVSLNYRTHKEVLKQISINYKKRESMKKVLAMMLAVCALSMSTVVYAQEQCTATKPVAQKEMS